MPWMKKFTVCVCVYVCVCVSVSVRQHEEGGGREGGGVMEIQEKESYIRTIGQVVFISGNHGCCCIASR
jgi:hypothetical protein